MKGFIFALDDSADVERILARGVFGVRQPAPLGQYGAQAWDPMSWTDGQLETFADWHSVAPGDLVFFFQDRLIFGVGEVVGLPAHPRQAALTNFADSEISRRAMPLPAQALYGPTDDAEWFRVRAVILFVKSPALFRVGIDMDEALSAYMAEPWPLHYWAGRSFVQLTEAEARLLRAAFLRRFAGQGAELATPPDKVALLGRATALALRPISSAVYINASRNLYVDAASKFRNEKTLHAALMEQLQANGGAFPLSSPGRSDTYHELPASPAKNPGWVDRMDLVACSVWPGTDIVTGYELIEAKKDQLSVGPVNTFDRFFSQPMRYVDFLARHYAGGNMHSVDVHIVAGSYSPKFLSAFHASPTLPRHYSLSPRDRDPIRAWERVRLWSYEWTGRLNLTLVGERYS